MWEKTHRYSGSLQKLTFYDLSPCGMNYQERFVTMDKEALNFEIFRYTKVDPECLRPVLIRITSLSITYLRLLRNEFPIT